MDRVAFQLPCHDCLQSNYLVLVSLVATAGRRRTTLCELISVHATSPPPGPHVKPAAAARLAPCSLDVRLRLYFLIRLLVQQLCGRTPAAPGSGAPCRMALVVARLPQAKPSPSPCDCWLAQRSRAGLIGRDTAAAWRRCVRRGCCCLLARSSELAHVAFARSRAALVSSSDVSLRFAPAAICCAGGSNAWRKPSTLRSSAVSASQLAAASLLGRTRRTDRKLPMWRVVSSQLVPRSHRRKASSHQAACEWNLWCAPARVQCPGTKICLAQRCVVFYNVVSLISIRGRIVKVR